MNRDRFLWELRCCLTGRMPAQEIERAIAYYTEYFDETGEQAALGTLGDPRDVASQVLGYEIPPEAAQTEFVSYSASPRRRRRIWPAIVAVALVVLLIPISIRTTGAVWNWVTGAVRGRNASPNTVIVREPQIFAEVPAGAALPDYGDAAIRHIETLAFGALSNLEIDVSAAEIVIQSGDEAQLEIFNNRTADGYELVYDYDEDGVLRVWDNGETSFWNIGFGDAPARVVVTIPADQQPESVSLRSEIGNINACLSATNLEVRTDLGSVELSGCNAAQLTVVVEGGRVFLRGGTFGFAELRSELGEIRTEQITTHGLLVSNQMGNIDIDGAFFGDTEIQQNLGAVRVVSSVSKDSYGYDLSTKLGEVRVDGMGSGSAMTMDGAPNFIRAVSELGAIHVTLGE